MDSEDEVVACLIPNAKWLDHSTYKINTLFAQEQSKQHV
jgi:hypothetical protein